MRILYGVYAMGHGHFSKAAVLVPLMEARGHEVRVVSSGADEPPSGYAFRWHRHYPGFAYVVTGGRTNYKKSFARWFRDTPRMMKHLWSLRRMAREFQPDLIVSDFEPLTASPIVNPGCEVVAISRQVALCDRAIALPEEAAFERKMTRTVTRLFTIGADRCLGYHYEPTSFRCVPPVIRPEIATMQRSNEGHLFVYNSIPGGETRAAEQLIDWTNRRRTLAVAYGFRGFPRGRHGHVEFRAASRRGLLDDMASARAVMCTAGLSTPIEAFLLGKPVAVVPIPGHFEQLANAYHLRESRVATWLTDWDYDAVADLPEPASEHSLVSWLGRPANRVLAQVLGEVEPVRRLQDAA